MSRFYVPPENIQKDEIFIDGNEARHILTVMRLKEKDPVVVFDGTGNEYTGFIKSADNKHKSLIVEIVKITKPLKDSIPVVALAQAIPKKDKMEYILEKATELGVSKIIPVITERTIVRLDKISGRDKLDRWQKIAVAAAKQCGRVSPPEVTPIVTFEEILSDIDAYDICMFATLKSPSLTLKKTLSGVIPGKILIFIGPEGGFADKEINQAAVYNCKFISLGRNTLKSDTAGLFVLSAINYEFS